MCIIDFINMINVNVVNFQVVSMIPKCQIEGIPGGLESEVDESMGVFFKKKK